MPLWSAGEFVCDKGHYYPPKYGCCEEGVCNQLFSWMLDLLVALFSPEWGWIPSMRQEPCPAPRATYIPSNGWVEEPCNWIQTQRSSVPEYSPPRLQLLIIQLYMITYRGMNEMDWLIILIITVENVYTETFIVPANKKRTLLHFTSIMSHHSSGKIIIL